MGMSGSTYNARANEITKNYYNLLLATGRRHLTYTRKQIDGTTIYFINQYIS